MPFAVHDASQWETWFVFIVLRRISLVAATRSKKFPVLIHQELARPDNDDCLTRFLLFEQALRGICWGHSYRDAHANRNHPCCF